MNPNKDENKVYPDIKDKLRNVNTTFNEDISLNIPNYASRVQTEEIDMNQEIISQQDNLSRIASNFTNSEIELSEEIVEIENIDLNKLKVQTNVFEIDLQEDDKSQINTELDYESETMLENINLPNSGTIHMTQELKELDMNKGMEYYTTGQDIQDEIKRQKELNDKEEDFSFLYDVSADELINKSLKENELTGFEVLTDLITAYKETRNENETNDKNNEEELEDYEDIIENKEVIHDESYYKKMYKTKIDVDGIINTVERTAKLSESNNILTIANQDDILSLMNLMTCNVKQEINLSKLEEERLQIQFIEKENSRREKLIQLQQEQILKQQELDRLARLEQEAKLQREWEEQQRLMKKSQNEMEDDTNPIYEQSYTQVETKDTLPNRAPKKTVYYKEGDTYMDKPFRQRGDPSKQNTQFRNERSRTYSLKEINKKKNITDQTII